MCHPITITAPARRSCKWIIDRPVDMLVAGGRAPLVVSVEGDARIFWVGVLEDGAWEAVEALPDGDFYQHRVYESIVGPWFCQGERDLAEALHAALKRLGF